MNENLNQTQQVNYGKIYKNNNINKKLLNQKYLPLTERNSSNIKNLKFILTSPGIIQKKINKEITQRSKIHNINTILNNNNSYETIQFNIEGNNNRQLFPQSKIIHVSLVKNETK